MSQIFISYSRSDKATIDELIKQLEAAGHVVWVDREGIRGGEQWRLKIVEAIENSHAFLLALSKNSIVSDHVRAEIDLAKESKKPIIPIRLQPVEIPASMRYQLAGIQQIDFSRDYQTGFNELLETLSVIDPAASVPAPRASKTQGTPPSKWLWIGGAAALLVILIIIGALLASPGSPGEAGEPPAQAQVTEPHLPEVAQQAQPTPPPPQKIVVTQSPGQQVGQAPPSAGAVSQGGSEANPVQALPPQFDPAALTTIDQIEPLLLQANIRLSEPEDLELTRTFFTGPDSAYHMLAIAALTVIGERRFIQPVHLDIVDKWYTEAAGSGYAERGPLDLDLVRQALLDTYNEYWGAQAGSLDEVLEPLN
jgi:hypothetical protein